jgi:hypothetical protein
LYNDHNRRVKRRQLDEEIQRSITAHDFAEGGENKIDSDVGEFPSLPTGNRVTALDSLKGDGPAESDEDLIREQLGITRFLERKACKGLDKEPLL